jgi:hypothetical protein
MRAAVEKVTVPTTPLLAGALARIDYADAYRARLPGGGAHNLDAVARAAFGSAPSWVAPLMWLRDRLVGVVGLKTARALRRHGPAPDVMQPGDRLVIFHVLARHDDELLLGEDDRHLDFRVSLLIERDAQGAWVVVSTLVHFNNLLGRLYFLPVRPFHRLIVPAMLQKGLRRYSV